MKRNKFATYENGKNIKGFWVEPGFIHLSGKSVNSMFPKFSGRNITDVVITKKIKPGIAGYCMCCWVCDKGRWIQKWSSPYAWMEWRAQVLYNILHPDIWDDENIDDEYKGVNPNRARFM